MRYFLPWQTKLAEENKVEKKRWWRRRWSSSRMNLRGKRKSNSWVEKFKTKIEFFCQVWTNRLSKALSSPHWVQKHSRGKVSTYSITVKSIPIIFFFSRWDDFNELDGLIQRLGQGNLTKLMQKVNPKWLQGTFNMSEEVVLFSFDYNIDGIRIIVIWLSIFKWFCRWYLYCSKVVLLLQELIAICISIMFFRCWLKSMLATCFSEIDCKI